MKTNKSILDRIAETIVNLDPDNAKKTVEEALEAGISPYELVVKGMAKGMEVVGERYAKMEYFLPELVMAGEAMKAAMEVLKPHLRARGAKPIGRVVIGTVKGDLHDIGKNIVVSMLTGGGFEVYDLGVDVTRETFVEKTIEVSADIVGMSALLVTTMSEMRDVIQELKKANLKVRVLVGGRPLTEEYANRIGADGYGKDALEAVKKAKELIQPSVDRQEC